MDRQFVAALSTYGEQLERIAELEQENERLRSPDLRTLYGYDAGFKAGLERAAEIAEEYRGHYYDAVAAIHAELNR